MRKETTSEKPAKIVRRHLIAFRRTSVRIGGWLGPEEWFLVPARRDSESECIMTCLFNSLEKLSDGKRRVIFYASFFIGGALTVLGCGAFATNYKGWAFVILVTGIFILITTGILWDTMAPRSCAPGEVATAPIEDDEPPPDYYTVMQGDIKNGSRSNSKWSLYSQGWCPNFSPKSGYGKTATAEGCLQEVVTDCPPEYKQHNSLSMQGSSAPPSSESPTDIVRVQQTIQTNLNENTGVPSGPTKILITKETKIELTQK